MGSKTWVNILEKQRNKLNDRAWQKFFISYKKITFYKIYYLFIEKIYKTQNVDIDKSLFYNKSEVNL